MSGTYLKYHVMTGYNVAFTNGKAQIVTTDLLPSGVLHDNIRTVVITAKGAALIYTLTSNVYQVSLSIYGSDYTGNIPINAICGYIP